MASYKCLIFLFVALFAVALAVEKDREKRGGLAHGQGYYGGYDKGYYGKGYPAYGGYYGYGLGYPGYGQYGDYGLDHYGHYGLGHYGDYGHHGNYY